MVKTCPIFRGIPRCSPPDPSPDTSGTWEDECLGLDKCCGHQAWLIPRHG